MKYLGWSFIIAGTALLTFVILSHIKYTPPVAIEPIPIDTAYRTQKNEEIKTLQARIDSLVALSKVVHTYPTKKLDSIVHIKSVIKDSLRCVDETTYRDLVINRMNFGEEKYSICLGQLTLKDSVIESHQRDLVLVNEKYEEVSLQLASVERKKYHWLIGGLLVGVGVSLAVMYANH